MHSIEAVVDRLAVGRIETRLADSLETALKLETGSSSSMLWAEKSWSSLRSGVPDSDSFGELEPRTSHSIAHTAHVLSVRVGVKIDFDPNSSSTWNTRLKTALFFHTTETA